MKIIFFLFSFVFLGQLFAQNLQPVDDKALLQFTTNNFEQKKLNIPIYFFGKKSKKEYATKENDTQILLPLGDTYIIYSKVAIENYEIIISDAPRQFYNLLFQFDNTQKNRLYATPSETIVQIKLLDHKNEGSKQILTFVNQQNKKQYKGVTDEKGFLEILLPNQSKYTIDVGITKNYSQIELPFLPFDKIVKILQFENELGNLQPSKDSALFNLTYLDLYEKPVKDEVFEAISIKTKKKYISTKTGKDGKAQIKVPIGDTYTLHAKYFKNFLEQKVGAKPDLYVLALNIRALSSADWEKQVAEMKKHEQKKEEEWIKMQKELEAYHLEKEKLEKQRIAKEKKEEEQYFIAAKLAMQKRRTQDSLVYVHDSLTNITENEKKAREIKLQAKLKMQVQQQNDSIKTIKENITNAKVRMKIEEERTFLRKKGYKIEEDTVILNVFRRNDWKNKLIIVDVTGSMYSYLNQFKSWYSSQHIKNKNTQFVLFNDGDDNLRINPRKLIGQTGGIYFCSVCDMKDLTVQLEKARSNGKGGDSPENDLEAVIKAIDTCKNYQEIILVVDNLSEVRDIDLLPQIKKPLKIVLCGASNSINTQYLNIAYKTKGSVHTIEGDLIFSSTLTQGQIIVIQGRKYMYSNNQFFLLAE
ncbi:MAG: hypothetical protein EAZ06_03090 [Cytophagales bacterium]|nr:MAG: hypothetical protein EAY69_03430 [Cytophagales bacterium]TAH30479.1 MAG: hypothetical protein EAZ06_03090 [Cytophagales bacterium]